MEKIKHFVERKFLNISDVRNIYGYSPDQLFSEAASGHITIYFNKTPSREIKMIVSFPKNFVDTLLGIDVEMSKKELDAMFPTFKDEKNEYECLYWLDIFHNLMIDAASGNTDEFDEFMNGFENIYDDQEIINIGPVSIYDRKGRCRYGYKESLDFPCPISRISFIPNILKSDYPFFHLKLTRKLRNLIGISDDSNDEFFIIYETDFNLEEAFADKLLLVLEADIVKLKGQVPDGNLSELSIPPYKADELVIAVNAWQSAVAQYKKSKAMKPSYLIRKWLVENHPELDERGAAFKRIVTVANWDSTPGPTKSPALKNR